ncbi:MAG: site-specific DNA-methyltransferase [Bacteroidota bacterium]|nr:site-specific DNA-methyltransferase [Bacteroidota bacterium]
MLNELSPLKWGMIHQGDCLDLMNDIDDQSVDMILCDLPYGTTQNRWDSQIPLPKLWNAYRRIIKPRGVIALTAQGLFTARVILSNPEWFRYKYVWVKSKPTNFLNARRQPLRQHEDVCVFYSRPPVYRPVMWQAMPYDKGIRKDQHTGSYGEFNPVHVKSTGERFPTDTLYCKTAESEGGMVWHPTQKPVALGRYLIRTFVKPGGLVLDNAFGSGSFLVAAIMEGCRYLGIEKNEEVHLFKNERIDYLRVAHERLQIAEEEFSNGTPAPPLFSSIHPAARPASVGEPCMVSVTDDLLSIKRKG